MEKELKNLADHNKNTGINAALSGAAARRSPVKTVETFAEIPIFTANK